MFDFFLSPTPMQTVFSFQLFKRYERIKKRNSFPTIKFLALVWPYALNKTVWIESGKEKVNTFEPSNNGLFLSTSTRTENKKNCVYKHFPCSHVEHVCILVLC